MDNSTEPEPATMNNAILVPRKKYATAKDWQSHRHIIERLYRDEDKTLEQLIAIMASWFGFHATYVVEPYAFRQPPLY